MTGGWPKSPAFSGARPMETTQRGDGRWCPVSYLTSQGEEVGVEVCVVDDLHQVAVVVFVELDEHALTRQHVGQLLLERPGDGRHALTNAATLSCHSSLAGLASGLNHLV